MPPEARDDPGDDEARAYQVALKALSRKERTTSEMREHLAGRGIEEDVLEATIDRLLEIGALDDRDYARRFAEDRQSISGWGRRRIARALADRGIEEEIIEAALAGEGPEEEAERAAAELARRGQAIADDRDRGKAMALLSRRGFEAEAAYEAIRRHADPDRAGWHDGANPR